jgi:hypothetical protein
MEIQQIPRSFWLVKRRVLPLGPVFSAVWVILEFSHDRPFQGVWALVFFAYFLFAYLRARRGAAEIPEIPEEYRSYEVYGFFGSCLLIGVTFFVLAVLGVAHIGIVVGTVALAGAVISAYAIVREAQNMRCRRREVSPPSAF